MRRKFLMALTFAAIWGVGWFALTPVRAMILAGRPRVKAAPPAAVAVVPQLIASKVEGPLARPGAKPPSRTSLADGTTAYSEIAALAVQVVGPRQALVEGVANLGSRLDDSVYMWAVRVVTEDKQVDRFALYHRQPFTLLPGAEVSPTFADTVDVPPGRSYVQLQVYQFPKGLDPTLLNYEEAQPYSMAQQAQRIDVP